MRPAARPIYRIRQFFHHIFARYSSADASFVKSLLTKKEFELFERLPVFEKRHAVDVARYLERFQREISPEGFQTLQKAGLLHDIGKVELPLSPIEKSIFVLLRIFLPKVVDGLARHHRFPKAGVFLYHNVIGAGMLKSADTEPEVVKLIENYQPGSQSEKLLSLLQEADEHIP